MQPYDGDSFDTLDHLLPEAAQAPRKVLARRAYVAPGDQAADGRPPGTNRVGFLEPGAIKDVHKFLEE